MEEFCWEALRFFRFMSCNHLQPPLSSALIWFLLLDSATGQPYKKTSISCIVRSCLSVLVVDLFRDAVHLKNSSILTHMVSSQLDVYENKVSFDKRHAVVDQDREMPLDPTDSLDVLGTQQDPVVVVVVIQSSDNSIQSAYESGHLKRKQRWIQLNDIWEEKSLHSSLTQQQPTSWTTTTHLEKTDTSVTLPTFITWNQVASIFHPTKYIQERRAMDDTLIEFLAQYLDYTIQCFHFISDGSNSKRLHFIAPILICVGGLFQGDVDLAVEEKWVGKHVQAQAHFDFVLRRGKKAVCVVLAKKDDMEQGMAEAVIGCQIVADISGLECVYGIITNYIQWNVVRCLDDKVEWEECSLGLTPKGPERKSLKDIAEKLYSMLS